VALTPIEVENTQFRVAFRGYAIDEVDAFLDRVQSELARLLSEPSAAAPAVTATGSEGQESALRTLLLAQRTADEAVAEARTEAEQIRTAAREEAGSTLTSARQEAEATLTSARAEAEATLLSAREEAEATRTGAREEAERVLAASRAEATGLDEQIAQRLEAALGDIDRRRQRLEGSVEQLHAFEREYRTRLRAYLEGQLRELDGSGGPDDDGAGVPVGAGGTAVGRPAVGAVRLDTRSGPQDGVPTSSAGAAGLVTAPDPAAATADR
jgi:DivIVA domain-containing protein